MPIDMQNYQTSFRKFSITATFFYFTYNIQVSTIDRFIDNLYVSLMVSLVSADQNMAYQDIYVSFIQFHSFMNISFHCQIIDVGTDPTFCRMNIPL